MNIFLNDQPLEIEGITPDQTLSDLMEAVEELVKENAMTIVELKADDSVFNPEQLDKLSAKKLVECTRIDIFAATVGELIKQAVEDGDESLEFIGEKISEISSELRLGNVKDAMNSYVELLDGLEWITAILNNLPAGFTESIQESSLEQERETALQEIVKCMDLIRTSQENQDWVSMADYIEYELPERIEQCRSIFDKVKISQ